MSSRLWLESVQSELTRRRLPRQEVARLIAELSDHLADMMEPYSAPGLSPGGGAARSVSFPHLTEEHMSMDATVADCLGSPADIADVAEREFRRRRPLLSRSPLAAFCTFILLPLPALCLGWVLAFLALMAVGELLDWCGIADRMQGHLATPMEQFLAHASILCVVMIPAAAVAILFGRLAGRTGHLWRWGLAACLLLAAGTALVNVQLTFSELPGKSTLMFGLGFGWSLLRLHHLGQFLIPLTVGLLVLRRSARRQQSQAT